MAIYTKSILKAKSEKDGTRISVMSRHTLEDGITPDERITNKSYDEYFPALAPPPKLVGDYYKRNLPFEEYAKRYQAYLQKEKVAVEVKALAQRALQTDITLLCIEISPQHCHRRLLAEECQRYEPVLHIEHR